MSAKDYKICPGLANIYIAKTSKKDPHLMLEDRRPLEECEIQGIIDWFVHNNDLDANHAIIFGSVFNEDKIISITIKNKEKMIDKKSLKKGDVLTWKNPIKGYMAFGRVKEDGSDVCDVIIGDGDSSNGPGDPFWENEPFAEKGTLKIITDPNLKAIINGYCDMLKA